MKEHQQNTLYNKVTYEDDLDLVELIKALWTGKWLIIGFTFVFAVGSIVYALSQPNMYRSEALLVPAEEAGGMRVPGQLGGLAALAGVNLGSAGGGSKVTLALEILKSREFLGRFIEKYDLKVPIMAATSWDIQTDTLILDPDMYDEASSTWTREVKLPLRPEPSLIETHEVFMDMLRVSEDQNSGMVSVSVEHYSPRLASEWTRLLVHEVNEEMRKRESEEAANSIAYLENQLERTSLADVQSMLYSLIEEQTKTLMLANVRAEYVLITIDPAVIPEKKSKPARALIVIIGTFIGGLLSSTFVIALNMFRRRSNEK